MKVFTELRDTFDPIDDSGHSGSLTLDRRLLEGAAGLPGEAVPRIEELLPKPML